MGRRWTAALRRTRLQKARVEGAYLEQSTRGVDTAPASKEELDCRHHRAPIEQHRVLFERIRPNDVMVVDMGQCLTASGSTS